MVDLLLFAKANTRNSEAILGVLDSFCGISGQKINKGKSRIIFSPNVDAQTKIFICNKLGIQATYEIRRYLGFPFFHKGRNCNAFNFVIDKVLSNTGRLVLIKSASTLYQITICNAMLSFLRLVLLLISLIEISFRALPKIRESCILLTGILTLPKQYDGLGIFQMRAKNEALLAKICWRIAKNLEALWAKIHIKNYLSSSFVGKKKNGSFSLKAAYVMDKGLNPLNLCTSPISWIWKIKSNPRIIFFFWLVSHNSILTCEVLGSRGFTLDSYCPLCMECLESIIHVLRDCKYARLFWTKLGVPHPLLNSFSLPLLN